MNEDLKVDEVYGITRDIPLNYVERESVDIKLLDNLSRRNHIVIFGSSKQGKTCLRKRCLDEDQCIVIQCLNNWGTYELNSAILKKAGYEIKLSSTKSVSGREKISASITGSLVAITSKITGSEEKEEKSESTSRTFDLEPEDPNDIISALESINFDKYIVLEDFHYLPVESQQNFSSSLKAFHESSNFCFIIVGVWLDENRLIVYNGDLTGRVISVNADNWEQNELEEVIDNGAELLNIHFTDRFKRELIDKCYDSVYIVQESCRIACKLQGIAETTTGTPPNIDINEETDVSEIIKGIVSQQDARYFSFLTKFSEGFQDTVLKMYGWLLYTILDANINILERGLNYRYIKDTLFDAHPRGNELNPGNLTKALKSISSLQAKKDIKPFILDYNESDRKLTIVDKGLYIWLDSKDPAELMELINIEDTYE
ncbi:hypothetical protein HNV12_11495 [Methanococcoides sp. SA1]|nr:hypothetical protein [Methanococcoides sp. SA1]